MALPTNAAERKRIPIYNGLLRYFPNALAAVAQLSQIGNDQHHPGTTLHWDKLKSADETDAMLRHMLDAAMAENGEVPTHDADDGTHHVVKAAWRALANLERLHEDGMMIYQIDPATVGLADWLNSE